MSVYGPILEHAGTFTDLLIEWVNEPLFLAENSSVVEANERACEVCGKPREGLRGMSLGAAIDLLYAGAARLAGKGGENAQVEVHRAQFDGRNVQVAVMRLAQPQGGAGAALRMVDHAIHLASKAEDRAQLLAGLCNLVVEHGGYALAWAGAEDPDRPGRVRIEASAGNRAEFLHDAEIQIEDTVLAPSRQASGGERVAECEDFAASEHLPWRERAMRSGFACSLSVPILAAGRAVAALTVFAAEPGAFGQQDLDALARVVGAAELGLELIVRRAAQKGFEQHASDWDDSFRAAFEQSMNGIVVYDLGGFILDVNAELCSRLGYTRQELLAMHMREVLTPECTPAFMERLRETGEQGFAAFEGGYVTRDGARQPMQLACRTYNYGDSRIVMAIVQRPHQAAGGAQTLALAVEAAQVGLFDWNLRTNTVEYSAGWKALLGYQDAEIGGDFGEWELRVHPHDAARMVAELKGYLDQRERTYESEYRMRCKDGSYRWMLTRGAVLYGQDGQPERMLGSHTDITDRKRGELRRAQTSQLQLAARIARGVRDDLETSATVIRGYADLMLPRMRAGDPMLPRIEAMREAGLQAGELADAAEADVADLNRVVTRAQQTLRRLTGTDVEIALAGDPALVRVAPGKLTELLHAMVLNASDSLPAGGGLRVAVEKIGALPGHLGDASGEHVRLTVSDARHAVDETRLELFDPVRHREEALLPAVGELVRGAQGVVAAANWVDDGSQVQVYFRAAEADAAPEPEAAAPGVCVMLVEGDPALRALAADVLRSAGHVVWEVAGAAEAIVNTEGRTGEPRVLVAELDGRMNGRELLAKLREAYPKLEAVFLSKVPRDEADVIARAFTPALLADAVRRAVRVT